MRYNIKDAEGAIVNTIICASDADAEALYPGLWELAEQDAPKPAPRHVTKLAFRNRFTSNEKVAMELAALHDSTKALNDPANLLAATLRASMADQRDARHIDLNRPDTRGGVQALEAAGLLASGRAAQILDAPVQPHEAYTGEA